MHEDTYSFLRTPPPRAVSPRPPAPEPELAVDEIQGHILPGFNCDHMAMATLDLGKAGPECRRWLAALASRVTTMSQTLEALERSEKGVVFLSVALTARGLARLTGTRIEELGFRDEAFCGGMETRSRLALLGDPVDTGEPGDPVGWHFGSGRNATDVLILTASNVGESAAKEMDRLLVGRPADVRLIYSQDMNHLMGARVSKEHFGFADAISQPALRGLVGGSPFFPRESEFSEHQAKPGQDLVWPGEFLFGYSGQCADRPFWEPGDRPETTEARGAPAWACNGSFLVLRRLRQEVGSFHDFICQNAAAYEIKPVRLAALMMGRWPNGAPLQLSDWDDPKLGQDEDRRNAFEFAEDKTGLPSDPEGLVCPFASHIRKVFPRNERSRDLPHFGRSFAHTKRLLRRSIPWGPISHSAFDTPIEDGVDRGLVFMAHMTSIRDQFEYVTKRMINDHNSKVNGIGYDAVVGQNDTLPNRFRAFKLPVNGDLQTFKSIQEWIVMTGGDYYFMPSRTALKELAS